MAESNFTFSPAFKLKQTILYIIWYLPGYLLCLIVFRLLNTTYIYNKPQLALRKGYLLVSNHQSALDSWFVGHLCFPRPVWFPAKSDLFEIPIVKNVIAGWRAFPVKRGSHDFKAMSFTSVLLNRYIVLIHPEGTRNPTRELKAGKSGVGKIIYDARCQVIPVYFEGMDRVLPKGRIMPNFFRTLSIIFGCPIDFADLLELENSRETSQKIVDRVMMELNNLQEELLKKQKYVGSDNQYD